MAAAIGAGLPISENGNMIIDIWWYYRNCSNFYGRSSL